MIDENILNNPNLLPDGSTFRFWKCETAFSKTYYVDGNNPKAQDSNDGSEEHPFLTVSHAASVARAGERVFIRKGRYYETVREVCGGTDPQHMVMFEGEDGAVITGAIEWHPDFAPSEGLRETPVSDESELFTDDVKSYYSQNGAKVYMGDLPRDGSLYEYGYNPFLMVNMQTLSWVPRRNAIPRVFDSGRNDVLDKDAHLKKRGLLFMDGKILRQVVRPFELWENEDVYFVDDTYKRIHLHLKDNGNPSEHSFELALKETGFMPQRSGLGFIYLKNIAFDKFSNPVKCPQYGAVCSNCGHHFMIENCSFTGINSVGLELGFIAHQYLHDGLRGYHIVRNCRFEDCGIGGISAVPTRGEFLEDMLVEGNCFRNCGFHDFALLAESAAIKSHYTRNSLYRNNRVEDVKYGSAIWLDKCNCNTRITGNVFTSISGSTWGAVFNEATLDTVLIDNNEVSGVKGHIDAKGVFRGGHGIYEHECENTLVIRNKITNVEGDGIHFRYTDPHIRRFLGKDRRTCMCINNKAEENIISGCAHGVMLSTSQDYSNGNTVTDASVSTFGINENGLNHNKESFQRMYGFEMTAQ